MAKLTLRKRSATGKAAREVMRFEKRDGDDKRIYVIRSDGALLVNTFFRSSFDGKPYSSGWKIKQRGANVEALTAWFEERGYTRS